MDKVLLLEDDLALGQGICLALKSDELQIDRCRSLKEVRKVSISDYALLILDINLPDGYAESKSGSLPSISQILFYSILTTWFFGDQVCRSN